MGKLAGFNYRQIVKRLKELGLVDDSVAAEARGHGWMPACAGMTGCASRVGVGLCRYGARRKHTMRAASRKLAPNLLRRFKARRPMRDG